MLMSLCDELVLIRYQELGFQSDEAGLLGCMCTL